MSQNRPRRRSRNSQAQRRNAAKRRPRAKNGSQEKSRPPGSPRRRDRAPGPGKRDRDLALGKLLKGRGRLLAGLGLVVAVHLAIGLSVATPLVDEGGDNAAYVALAHSLAQDGSYRELWHPGAPGHARYPPLYPALMAAMILAGAKTWTAFKALSLGLTTLASAFCFLWVRRCRGDQAGLVVGVLFATSFSLVDASMWIRSEPLFVAVATGCLWLLTPKRPPGERARTTLRPLGPAPPASERPPPGNSPRTSKPVAHRPWELAAGLALAAAAWFTRAAGAPLIAAATLWLVLGKRWRALGAFGAVLALPAFLWLSRDSTYGGELLMVNPYQPDLGRVGLADMAARFATNSMRYVGEHLGDAITNAGAGGTTAVLGSALAAAALAGWIKRVRAGGGVAEWFVLLYGGLLLLWPTQGSSHRFVVPLLPPLLLYVYETTASLGSSLWHAVGNVPRSAGGPRRRGRARGSAKSRTKAGEQRPMSDWRRLGAAAALALAMAVPVRIYWPALAATSRGCAGLVAAQGPFGCYPETFRSYHLLAAWARDHLPPGSLVYSRKPRLFYVFSGLPSVVFPFTADPSRFMAVADSLDVGYVVRSRWGGMEFVDRAISTYPERFCGVVEIKGESSATSLWKIRPPSAEPNADASEPAGASDPAEPTSYAQCPLEGEAPRPAADAYTVPILAGWDR